jgi:uncharacterized membrane protein YhaH (DUF805 family)
MLFLLLTLDCHVPSQQMTSRRLHALLSSGMVVNLAIAEE